MKVHGIRRWQTALAAVLLGTGLATAAEVEPAGSTGRVEDFRYRFWNGVYGGASGGWGFRLSPSDFDNSAEGFGGQSSYRYSFFVGKWVRPSYAWQVSYQNGDLSHFNRKLHFFSLDVLWDVRASRRGFQEAEKRFRVIPLVGLGVATTSAAMGNYSLLFSYGLQGRIRLGRHFDMFAEARGQLVSDRILYQTSAPCFCGLFGFQAGLGYSVRLKGRPVP